MPVSAPGTPRQITYDEWLARNGENFKPCDECEGTGLVDHFCDCDRCTEDDEQCWNCDGRGTLNTSRRDYEQEVLEDAQRWAAYTGTPITQEDA